MRPDEFRLYFLCSNRAAAIIAPGLNTLLFSASPTPVPDIWRWQQRSPTMHCERPWYHWDWSLCCGDSECRREREHHSFGGYGYCVVAGEYLFMPDRPASGQCISGIGPNVTTQINANATPTFGIFVQGNGNVPFDPAANRIFVRFKDAGGVTRGSTSVAVRTQ